MTRSFGLVGTLLGAALSWTSPLVAQEMTGSLVGIVRDSQGGVIPGATVTLASETRGTRLEPVVTDASGAYVFMRIPADTYTVAVAMPGFRPARQMGVAVLGDGSPPTSAPIVLSPSGAPFQIQSVGPTSPRSLESGPSGPADCNMRVIVGQDIDQKFVKPAPADRQYYLRIAPAARCFDSGPTTSGSGVINVSPRFLSLPPLK